MHNDVIKQQPVNFLDLERAYSDFATYFITTSAKKRQPFFLYYPSHVSKSMTVNDYITGAVWVLDIEKLKLDCVAAFTSLTYEGRKCRNQNVENVKY